MNDRKTDKWIYTWLPKIIEVILIVGVIYGGMKVTLANLCADVNTLKIRCEKQSAIDEAQNLKTNTLETQFVYIKETLNRIERKLK